MTKKNAPTKYSVHLAVWEYARPEILRLVTIGVPLLYCGLLITLFVIDCARILVDLICG